MNFRQSSELFSVMKFQHQAKKLLKRKGKLFMNKSGNDNRSVRNTKKKLCDGLLQLMAERPLNKISVKELTELVDVNRGTFYFHYTDVFDLLHKIEDEFFAQFDQMLGNEVQCANKTYPYLQGIFTFLGENSNLCRVLFSSNGDMAFLSRIKKLVDERCSSFWRQTIPNGDSKQFELYNSFIINGCIGVIQYWLDDGLRESPEEISRLAGTIIAASVKQYLTQ